jgi:hypothetical protein
MVLNNPVRPLNPLAPGESGQAGPRGKLRGGAVAPVHTSNVSPGYGFTKERSCGVYEKNAG